MPVDVLTNRYDNKRSSTNLNETTLTAANVNVNGFGKLFDRTVDGDLYSQPLVVTGVNIGRLPDVAPAPHNVVYLATSRNWVYAYDAEDPRAFLPYWAKNLGTPMPKNDISPFMYPPGSAMNNFSSEIGIISTPVIRKVGDGGTIYVVAKTRIDAVASGTVTPSYHYHLHALNIQTGDPAVAAQEIKASVTSSNGTAVPFDALPQLNRPGLLLLKDNTGKDVIFMAFSSLGDAGGFYGWVVAHDADTLAFLACHCTTPDWGEGGIWQSGTGLAEDENGFIYYVSGNGASTFDHDTLGRYPQHLALPGTAGAGPFVKAPGFGCSIVKLKFRRNAATPGASTLSVDDSYTPSDTTSGGEVIEGHATEPLNEHDFDLCAGPVLFEATSSDGTSNSLVLGGGKNGRFYVLNRGGLGGWQAPVGGIPSKNPKALQEERLCNFHIHGAPVYWQSAPQGPSVYVWSEMDRLGGFAWDPDARKFKNKPYGVSQFGFAEGPMLMPGGFIAVSANGTTRNTGIIWASHPTADANNATVPGVLRAFDASTIETLNGLPCFKLLWFSDHDPLGPDRVGMFAKFNPPVIANGKVYLATFSRQLVVYGLLPNPPGPHGMEGMAMGTGTVPTPALRAGAAMSIGRGPVQFEQTVGTSVEGSVSGTCEKYTVLGSGRDISGKHDEFHFVGRAIDGSQTVTVTALVVNIQEESPLTMAGVMIRVATDPDPKKLATDSPHASMVITPRGGSMMLDRTAPGAAASATKGLNVKPPYWVRVVSRPVADQGRYRLTASISGTGHDWQVVGQPVEIASQGMKVQDSGVGMLHVGLVVCAHSEPGKSIEALRMATFEDFEIQV